MARDASSEVNGLKSGGVLATRSQVATGTKNFRLVAGETLGELDKVLNCECPREEKDTSALPSRLNCRMELTWIR